MFVLAITFVFVPPLMLLSFRYVQGKRRRKLVNSPRKIKVMSDEERTDPCAGGHRRSKRNARPGPDGTYVSVCRTCGAPMRRTGPGDWVVIE
jgi:hypothetical protein